MRSLAMLEFRHDRPSLGSRPIWPGGGLLSRPSFRRRFLRSIGLFLFVARERLLDRIVLGHVVGAVGGDLVVEVPDAVHDREGLVQEGLADLLAGLADGGLSRGVFGI